MSRQPKRRRAPDTLDKMAAIAVVVIGLWSWRMLLVAVDCRSACGPMTPSLVLEDVIPQCVCKKAT